MIPKQKLHIKLNESQKAKIRMISSRKQKKFSKIFNKIVGKAKETVKKNKSKKPAYKIFDGRNRLIRYYENPKVDENVFLLSDNLGNEIIGYSTMKNIKKKEKDTKNQNIIGVRRKGLAIDTKIKYFLRLINKLEELKKTKCSERTIYDYFTEVLPDKSLIIKLCFLRNRRLNPEFNIGFVLFFSTQMEHSNSTNKFKNYDELVRVKGRAFKTKNLKSSPKNILFNKKTVTSSEHQLRIVRKDDITKMKEIMKIILKQSQSSNSEVKMIPSIIDNLDKFIQKLHKSKVKNVQETLVDSTIRIQLLQKEIMLSKSNESMILKTSIGEKSRLPKPYFYKPNVSVPNEFFFEKTPFNKRLESYLRPELRNYWGNVEDVLNVCNQASVSRGSERKSNQI